jgi:hypothetical protein
LLPEYSIIGLELRKRSKDHIPSDIITTITTITIITIITGRRSPNVGLGTLLQGCC